MYTELTPAIMTRRKATRVERFASTVDGQWLFKMYVGHHMVEGYWLVRDDIKLLNWCVSRPGITFVG